MSVADGTDFILLSGSSQVGIGGTPFMKYLKKHRDEMAEHAIGI